MIAVSVNRDEILTALKSAVRISKTQTITPTLTHCKIELIAGAGARISLSSGDGASGARAASDEVICSYSGPAIKIGLNARYLREALAQNASENTEIDGMTAICIRDCEDRDRFSLIMPTRV